MIETVEDQELISEKPMLEESSLSRNPLRLDTRVPATDKSRFIRPTTVWPRSVDASSSNVLAGSYLQDTRD